jgi:hypothetical protein
MPDDATPDDPTAEETVADFELEPAVEALVEDDSDLLDDGTRHYEQDPNHLSQFARDADETEQADLLEVDQTELEELGLTLDDPHQPEAE